MGNSSSSNWSGTYEAIKHAHDEAYHSIEEAITLEERERPHDAIEKYKQGILLIDKALSVLITVPDNPDAQWERACQMIQKMKKTRGEVMTRINCIQSSPNFIPEVPPPSYDEAMASSSSSETHPKTYQDLAVALSNLHIESPNSNAEVIYTHNNVKLYFISPDGVVLSTSQPETLNIALIDEHEANLPKAFLQIGDWVYPLVAGVSPCYRTDYGAFILPDVYSPEPGYSIGIILPSDADADVYELLENILHGIVSQTVPEIHPRGRRESSISETISNSLINGAYFLSKGLIKGAEKTGDLINYGTPKIINSITPTPEPTHISPNLRKGFQIAQSATNKAADVTSFVADKVGLATTKLGQYLAPHIKKHGTRLLTSGFNLSEEDAAAKVNDVLVVTAGALEGFSTVYRGLETSAAILGQNLKNSSVKIIQHKYGEPATELAGNTMNTFGNVWNISNNVKMFTPKGIVKYTAKQTGKALASENTKIKNGKSASSNNEGLQASSSTMHNDLEEDNIEFYFPSSSEDMHDIKLISKKD